MPCVVRGKQWTRCEDASGADFWFGIDVKRSPSGGLRVAVFVPVWVRNSGTLPVLLRHCPSARPAFLGDSSRPLAGQEHVK